MITLRPSVRRLAALPLLGLWLPAQACIERAPTPQTFLGPHDYTSQSSDNRLWREGDPGEPLFLSARVLDACSNPIAGAEVRIVHADSQGNFVPGRFRARLETDAEGAFKVVTVLPGYAGGWPRHIHFVITHPAHGRLVTWLFFKNDPAGEMGGEQLALVLEEIPRGDGKAWVAGYEFVLGGGPG